MHRRSVILLTGPPGVGKTTLILKLEEYFRAQGLKTAGMVTQEVRKDRQRIGFKLRDLVTGEEGWLAKTGVGSGPRVGRYSVVAEDLENVGIRALQRSLQAGTDIVFVDEIGPMEMSSAGFRKTIAELLNSDRTLVATVKQDSRYEEVATAKKEAGIVTLELTRENREAIFERITSEIEKEKAAQLES